MRNITITVGLLILTIPIFLLHQKPAFAKDAQITILVKLTQTSAKTALVADLSRALVASAVHASSTEVLQLAHSNASHSGPQYFSLTVNQSNKEELLALVQHFPFVEYAEFDMPVTAFFTPNDNQYPNQWHFGKINLENAWDYDSTSPLYGGDPSIVVAVIDTGIAYENYTDGGTVYAKAPDFANTAFTSGYDFVSNDTHPNDQNGHGTHVAGTIAESTNNASAVAGIAFNSTIMPIRVLNRTGSGTTSDVAEGIDFAVSHGADIINLSLGAVSDSQIMHDAINNALAHNIVVVAAAGNSSSSTISYPAAYSGVIGVTALSRNDSLASYSNYGAGVSLTAPGGDGSDYIWQQTYNAFDSDNLPLDYVSFGTVGYQGTSQATPHVSGAAALLLARGVDPSGIAPLLESTATDLGVAGYDTLYGYGRINIAAAMDAFLHDTTAANTVATVSPSSANGLNGYYNTVPIITLSAQDSVGGSGVRTISYRFNSSTYTQYTTGLHVNDGIQTMQYFSTDVSGNIESPKSISLSVDTTGPCITLTSPGIGSPSYAITVKGTVVDAVSGTASLTLNGSAVSIAQNGTFSTAVTMPAAETVLTLVAVDNAGNQTTLQHTVRLTPKERIIVGAGPGGGPQVLLYTETGKLLTNFFAYDSRFRGGVHVASGNIDQRAGEEIIAGAGVGGGPQVRLYDSKTNLTGQFFAYDIKFRGGVHVSTGDLNGDGSSEIISAPGAGGGPQIKVYSNTAKLLSQFMAFAPSQKQGVSLAAGDVNADGSDEIVAGLQVGADPTVKVFNRTGTLLHQFYAFDQRFRGGLELASGDVNGDGTSEIIAAPQTAGGPQVRIFTAQGKLINQFFAFSSTSRNGLHIASGDVDGNGVDEIIVGAGKGMDPQVKIFSASGQLLYQFMAFPSFVRNGVFVAAGSQE